MPSLATVIGSQHPARFEPGLRASRLLAYRPPLPRCINFYAMKRESLGRTCAGWRATTPPDCSV